MAISPCRRLGFTLVELLVVISIIGTLVALLIPAVQGARKRARQLTCLNIRQIGIATFSYDTTKGQVPGMTQFIKRSGKEWASIGYDTASSKFKVVSVSFTGSPDLTQVSAFSWATMLLNRIERADIWDQIVSPPRDGSGVAQDVLVPPIDQLHCPDDREISSQPDLAGLSYVGNSGGWDPHGTGSQAPLIVTNNIVGDTAENGIFHDQGGYERLGKTAPKVRLSNITDGAATTLLFTENISRTYDPATPGGPPAFSWLFGSEQQLGFVWVVPTAPNTSPVQPVGNTDRDQEAINRDSQGAVTYPANQPRYARPASSHENGMNVAFCDGHADFLRDDIDYMVYQQLMTPWGRKCVDPAAHDAGVNPVVTTHPIYKFRNAPPLADKDWK